MAERSAPCAIWPFNFPQTFLPERRLLIQLLPFAGQGGSGNKVEIGAQTAIPTGASTGKVESMIQQRGHLQ
jgi:hypothetical protein